MKKPALFILYVLMWSVQGVLVHRLQRSESGVNATAMVIAQELLKLVFSIFLFTVEEGPISGILTSVRKHALKGASYIIPAALYAVYNNLTFLGLEIFEPSRYFVLMQFRIVVTGFVYSWFFPRAGKLSLRQWVALTLVMVGAMLRETSELTNMVDFSLNAVQGYLVVIFQIFLSTTAGVVNEKLLKKYANTLSLSVQNIFMYSMSLLVNLGLMFGQTGGLSFPDLSLVLPVIVNGALLGLVTSMFLRELNSVLKSVASAIELWVTSLLSAVMFGYPFGGSMVAGIAILSLGVVLYACPPGKQKTKNGRLV